MRAKPNMSATVDDLEMKASPMPSSMHTCSSKYVTIKKKKKIKSLSKRKRERERGLQWIEKHNGKSAGEVNRN